MLNSIAYRIPIGISFHILNAFGFNRYRLTNNEDVLKSVVSSKNGINLLKELFSLEKAINVEIEENKVMLFVAIAYLRKNNLLEGMFFIFRLVG